MNSVTIDCCRGCPDRTVEPNCHLECEKYLQAKARRAKVMEKRKEHIERRRK